MKTPAEVAEEISTLLDGSDGDPPANALLAIIAARDAEVREQCRRAACARKWAGLDPDAVPDCNCGPCRRIRALASGAEAQPLAAKPAVVCYCGRKDIPAGIDAVNWYWQRHGRNGCTLELPDRLCPCGLLRSEHISGHANTAASPQGKGDDRG